MAGERAVWITRAEPGASTTAERVQALGLEPVVAPLLVVRRIAEASIDLTGAAAIAFTSANAVAAFAELTGDRALPVFAVGDATAAAARKAGFADIRSAGGDVAALAEAIAQRRDALKGVVLYPAAAEPAQNLAGLLESAGVEVRQVAVYETVAVAPSAALIERLPRISAVLVHSARAAEALAGVLAAHPAAHLTAYGISQQALRPLANTPLARRIAATAPNEAALMRLLEAAKPA